METSTNPITITMVQLNREIEMLTHGSSIVTAAGVGCEHSPKRYRASFSHVGVASGGFLYASVTRICPRCSMVDTVNIAL